MLKTLLFVALPLVYAVKTEVVGAGGCSCGDEVYCRTGYKQFKLGEDACAKQARAIGAGNFEWGAPTNCITHMTEATGGNGYPGVTCYKVLPPTFKLRGRGGCSCNAEKFCRTGSKVLKVGFEECKANTLAMGAKGMEFGGTNNCIVHMQQPSGANRFSGVKCYEVDEAAVGWAGAVAGNRGQEDAVAWAGAVAGNRGEEAAVGWAGAVAGNRGQEDEVGWAGATAGYHGEETAVGPFGDYGKRAMKDVPVLVKRGVECQSSDKYIGKRLELRECASLVYFEGGSYLVYGTGPNAGWCYMENTSSESCPEGWETDDYDFYKLTTGLEAESVAVASETSGGNVVIQAFALFGFLITAYGAVRHYVK